MAEQVHSIVQMTPGVMIGCYFIVAMLVVLSFPTVYFYPVLVWATTICAAQSIGIRAWSNSKNKPRRKSVSPKAMKRICGNGAVLGSLWGFAMLMVLPFAGLDMKLTMLVAITGIMGGGGFALAAVPQAAISFVMPAAIGTLIGILLAPNSFHAFSISVLIGSYVIVIPFIAIKFARNLSHHIVTEMVMREQQNTIGLLLKEYEENANDWVWETSKNGRIQNASPRFIEACNLTTPMANKYDFLDLFKECSITEDAVLKIEQHMKNKEPFRDIELTLAKNEKVHWLRLSGKPSYADSGDYAGYIGIGFDITSDKEAENKINLLAHTDPLTGLMNRAIFNEKMDEAVGNLERHGTAFSLLFLDLDKFKTINDTRGHLVGDKLLQAVAQRIRDNVDEGSVIARLGGDEFAVVVHKNCNASSVAKLAEKLITAISEPYEIDGDKHKIGLSIGITLAPQNGTRPTQLLRNADLALYRSKADGRGVFRFFESQMDADQREKRLLENELRAAIDNDEFELYFQPLVSSLNSKATGMEALIRWHHPIRGLISPAEFIPLAEQSSLIHEIGHWTLKNACKNATEWPNDVTVAVNLSAQHFVSSDIVDITKNALAESRLPAHRLELEITESVLVNNPDDVYEILKSLKELGVAISLDDFGTGYSSLSYIMKFPFDKIKIDQSFVSASDNDDTAKAILQMITTLGESLNIKITAEGVETVQQVQFLRSVNCHQFQGYFFSRPLRAEDLPTFFLKDLHKSVEEEIALETAIKNARKVA
ncbi:MAG: EAL domain-containing protein [Rhizobiaceae bacterium]|nr:EAL domain-containing protein [Rhizobiaceae bacterium]